VKYTYGLGLIAQKRSTVKKWYMPDALGNTRMLLDNNKTTTDTYVLDAWGGSIASTGSTINSFRYVGRQNYYTDSETALKLLGVRYYSSGIGRFIAQDPIGLAGGDLNLYRYVKDRPTIGTDPRGLGRRPSSGMFWGEKRTGKSITARFRRGRTPGFGT